MFFRNIPIFNIATACHVLLSQLFLRLSKIAKKIGCRTFLLPIIYEASKKPLCIFSPTFFLAIPEHYILEYYARITKHLQEGSANFAEGTAYFAERTAYFAERAALFAEGAAYFAGDTALFAGGFYVLGITLGITWG